MISVDHLTVRVGGFALENIGFEVPTGQYAVLMGRTGAGKTTLLEALCGLRALADGAIRLNGREVTRLKPAERGIGYVPQDRALFRTMTVREHLGFALTIRKQSRPTIQQSVAELSRLLGIAHLLDYPNSYERHIHRFADFNAGWYASRNAAFQAAVSEASGVPLALDGDLALPGDRVGATEAAVRSLAGQLGMSEDSIARQLRQGDRHEFERSNLHARLFALAERRAGRALPRAILPRIDLQSPKITRKLTTAWFAERVQTRYQRCVKRAFSGQQKSG